MRSINNIEKTIKTIVCGKIVIGFPWSDEVSTYVRSSVGRIAVWVDVVTGESITTTQLIEQLMHEVGNNFSLSIRNSDNFSTVRSMEVVNIDILELNADRKSHSAANHKYPTK